MKREWEDEERMCLTCADEPDRNVHSVSFFWSEPGSSSFPWVMTGLRSTTHIICHHRVVQVHISLSLFFSLDIHYDIHSHHSSIQSSELPNGFKKKYFSCALLSCLQDRTRTWCTRKSIRNPVMLFTFPPSWKIQSNSVNRRLFPHKKRRKIEEKSKKKRRKNDTWKVG